jgi:hypothetical protein
MTKQESEASAPASLEEIQKGWYGLTARVSQLEAEKNSLQQENKAVRSLLERSIEHRLKSHSELVLLLTTLVSKLPLNDIGVIVSKLVEHNTNVGHYLAALIKGTAEVSLPQPVVLKTLEQTKRELLHALKPLVEELIQLETPLEVQLLREILADPESFFSSRTVRANRCFIKGLVPRERVVKEFGQEALACFNDVTTDPKLNPHPKQEEIVLTFKNDFEPLLNQNPSLSPTRKEELLRLYQRVQCSKAGNQNARQQRATFQKLSFLVELLHFYEHQNTEAPDVLFAQRLPALAEQLVIASSQEELEEKWITQAEELMGFVINPDHRQMIINNIGKAGGAARTLKYVLKLRAEKVLDRDAVITDFIKHLLPNPQKVPPAKALSGILRLIHPEMRRGVVRNIMSSDRIRKEDAERLGKELCAELGFAGMIEQLKAEERISPELERQMTWAKIRDLIAQRTEAAVIAATIRERLNAKYDAEEIRQSWITLSEAEPLMLIRIFCHVPYLPNGKTDPIAQTVIESYVSRLIHEKYAPTYRKVIKSLKSMFAAKPDSPTLLTFMGLVKWASPEAAKKIGTDIGVPALAQPAAAA